LTAFGGKGGFAAESAFDGNVPSVVFVARGDTGLDPGPLQDLIYGNSAQSTVSKG